MAALQASMRVGTAAWNVPRAVAASFPVEGTHLERYAQVLNCCEINSSFYRSHRSEVYARWAAQTPRGFRFAVKLPRAISHDASLRAARRPLQGFIDEVAGLGDKLAVLLLQLPPSFAFERRPVQRFFGVLAALSGTPLVCEPRHASWFEAPAERLLRAAGVGRFAADPARWPAAAIPGGWRGADDDGAGAVLYHRWHGSPRIYWSAYDDAWLRARAHDLQRWPKTAICWTVFDNTASGAAAADALRLRALLARTS